MPVLDKGIEALVEALQGQEFRAADEFDSFVTFEREGEALKIQVGPDGSFAAFNGDDELVAEGEGAEDLFRIEFAARLRERLEVYKQIEGEVVDVTPENEADR